MLIEMYLNRLRLSSYREATITTRNAVMSNFERTMAPRGLADATRHDLERFLARPLAPATRRLYRSSLRHFYAWSTEEGFTTTNPAERIPPIRVKHGTPRPVSEDDLRTALGRADQRMRAWLLLMSLAGLRCMEVSGLLPADLVRSEDGWLLMLSVTKGGAPAVMPAHPEVVRSLLSLPVVGGGTWWNCGPKNVGRLVAAHLHSCGVDATAHQLRHTAATAWLRSSGNDLLAVRDLMRHQSVDTTSVYAQLSPDRPREVVHLVNMAG